MQKQKLQQNQKLNISVEQIQFLNLLQIPAINLEQRIREELEDNPTLEEELVDDEIEEKSESGYSKNTYSLKSKENKTEKITLSSHLKNQLIGEDFDDKKLFILDYIIESLDPRGYLTRNAYSISSDLLTNHDIEVDEDYIKNCIKILQTLEPKGVGASDLKECILIQLQLLEKNEISEKSIEAVTDFYEDFMNKKYESLCEKLKIDLNTLKKIYQQIEKLNPFPGKSFDTDEVKNNYIVHDFSILNIGGKLEMKIEKGHNINLNISSYYENLIQETKDKEAKKFLKEKIDRAVWFKESLIKRQITLKKVIKAIMSLQESYFLSGDISTLKPMKLADVSELINMDVSTVSRVSNGKYIETSFGSFLMKELFSEAYKKENGESVSNKYVKMLLKDIVEKENKLKPFNDEKIVEILEKDEFFISRRTVAKYRKELKIPNARLRKSIV